MLSNRGGAFKAGLRVKFDAKLFETLSEGCFIGENKHLFRGYFENAFTQWCIILIAECPLMNAKTYNSYVRVCYTAATNDYSLLALKKKIDFQLEIVQIVSL